jgi:transcriptional regulator with XRE-family HTH domain
MTFAKACLSTRIDLDLSRQDLADRVGVTPSYIGRIERGEANPSLMLIEAIANALGLDLGLSIRPPTFPGGPHFHDAVHARCSAYVDRHLRAIGWATAREVEIVHGRSHGWIDLLVRPPHRDHADPGDQDEAVRSGRNRAPDRLV